MSHAKAKLLLIPCSGDETADLAEKIYSILREEYQLGDVVELLLSNRRREVSKEREKDHRHPLVSDYFEDYEIQVDVGRNELKDIIRGKHVVLLEHLLTPNRPIFPGSPPNGFS